MIKDNSTTVKFNGKFQILKRRKQFWMTLNQEIFMNEENLEGKDKNNLKVNRHLKYF